MITTRTKRTVWNPNHGKFEKADSPYSSNQDDSISPYRADKSNTQTFVVEWQMTNERGMSNAVEILNTKSDSQSQLYF